MGSIPFIFCAVLQSQAPELAPIYKVSRVDPKRWETVYVLSEEKAKELDVSENFTNRGLLGYASREPGPGKTALYESYHDGWHIYYTEVPPGAKLRKGTTVKPMGVHVWEKPGEGRVPIFAVSGQSYRHMRFYNTKEEALATLTRAKKALGKNLKYLGAVFYLEPAKDENRE